MNNIIIFPFASWSGRMWPAENFVELSKRLIALYPDFRLVFSGGEKDIIVPCLELFIKTNKITNMIGKTSLIELVELTKKSKLVISNETSIIHIAAANKIPSVCILGGGHFGRYLPYGINFEEYLEPISVYKKMECFSYF